MTEQECRELFRKDCDEKMKPLVEQVTNLVMKAYEYGLDLGLSTANKIIENKQLDWKDQRPRKGLWDAEKVCKVLKDYMLKERFFDNRIERTAIIDNIVCDLRKAMED